MLRDILLRLSSSPLYRDFRFQLRLVVMTGAMFIFLFPSLVGMSLFYLDLFSDHPELDGFPQVASAVDAFIMLAGDAVAREAVFGLIFATGLAFILAATHGEKRLAPVLDALGLLLVMNSLFFLLVATDRCVPNLGCSLEFFSAAVVLAYAFGLAGVWIPRTTRRFAGWLSLPYVSLLMYQSFLWLVTLARTPRVVLNWETTFAILLIFATMLLPITIAVYGFSGKFEPKR